ncbi:MAG: prephenate dehydrogenase/arogenate dehydrogenase family protein [Planctomycetota bacterium]
MLDDIPQITIVGTGLIGASVGLGVKAAGYAGRVVGVARSEATLERARAVGAIDDGATELADAVRVDGKLLVVLAVPVGKTAEVFRTLAEHQRRGLYVTDAGSTKLGVAADAKRHLTQPQFFIPAHPMAGSERSGPESADADLFRGRLCVLCPDENTDAAALAAVTALWQSLGATLHTMTPDEHDHQVAAVSHLPHLAAVLLTLAADDIGPLTLASTGFRDTTRLALSNPPMRRDIVAANRKPIGEALDRFAARLNDLRGLVRKAKDDELLDLLTRAQSIRDGLRLDP